MAAGGGGGGRGGGGPVGLGNLLCQRRGPRKMSWQFT